jgi:integrase
MGRKSLSGGVRAKGSDRIQFDFEFAGERYRPEIKRPPSEANLRRARVQLQGIKERIQAGTFKFSEEFPDYRYMANVEEPQQGRTCDQVFDDFLAHCEARVAQNDMAFASCESYRSILDGVWRPEIGKENFDSIKYSALLRIVDRKKYRSKKRRNNVVSALRCAFEFGYRDNPERHNPAAALKCFRLSKKDRRATDPFSVQEAEEIIAGIHSDWGEAQGNYDEFRFFSGLRPSEQIALKISDVDLVRGTIGVTKARVMKRDKDRTKTSEDRIVELCPRAVEVLKRQLELRERYVQEGRISHDDLFFLENGAPIRDLNVPYDHWVWTLMKTVQVRYREPYNARHSFVSWNLMIGKNLLWVSKQHGHSVQTMLSTYAAWVEGAKDEDIEAIKRAMNARPVTAPATRENSPLASPEFVTNTAPGPRQNCVSRCMREEMYGGKGGTRTLDPGIMSAVL